MSLGSKLGTKIYEKSVKKWSQLRKASWNRFMQDFHGFSEPSWDRKSSQDTTRRGKQGKTRLRRGKTRQCKTKARQDCTLVAKNSPGVLFVPPCVEVGGVYPTLRGLPPQDPRPSVPRVVGDSCCDFFGNLVALLFRIVFRCLFGSILAPVSLPTCLPKSTKIQEKSIPRCHPSWTPFFYRFLSIFASNFYPPKPTKR